MNAAPTTNHQSSLIGSFSIGVLIINRWQIIPAYIKHINIPEFWSNVIFLFSIGGNILVMQHPVYSAIKDALNWINNIFTYATNTIQHKHTARKYSLETKVWNISETFFRKITDPYTYVHLILIQQMWSKYVYMYERVHILKFGKLTSYPF